MKRTYLIPGPVSAFAGGEFREYRRRTASPPHLYLTESTYRGVAAALAGHRVVAGAGGKAPRALTLPPQPWTPPRGNNTDYVSCRTGVRCTTLLATPPDTSVAHMRCRPAPVARQNETYALNRSHSTASPAPGAGDALVARECYKKCLQCAP
ncbi:hypothetical protein EVAR_35411_1 [Eumeta japonica]|uniref:Uncharacterized protein n=1 Tax=Eumeta variegata TaxID=151549 RepID=A0A4C1X997_EUMVA|nr:hypothetical protein EVAR_35411_1 [Eumeta japonica]